MVNCAFFLTCIVAFGFSKEIASLLQGLRVLGRPRSDPITHVHHLLGVSRDNRKVGRTQWAMQFRRQRRRLHRVGGKMEMRGQGHVASSPRLYLSQLDSWLWLVAISTMSSISSSMRKGCCEVGSSSGHEYGLM